MRKSTSGFTIVELLIVIVVVAVLAAITIVAFNGIQERARITKTVTAAKEGIKLLQLYKAANGAYPTAGLLYECIGEYPSDTCQYTSPGVPEVAESTAFKNFIATVGTMPQPDTTIYALDGTRTGGGAFYHVPLSAVIYYLPGLNKPCTAGGTATNTGGGTTQCTYTLP